MYNGGGGIAGIYPPRNNGVITPVNNPMRDGTADAYAIYTTTTSPGANGIPLTLRNLGGRTGSATPLGATDGIASPAASPGSREQRSVHQATVTAADTALGNINNSFSIIGDVAEPFWVQQSTQAVSISPSSGSTTSGIGGTAVCCGGTWCDPDEAFLSQARRDITPTDRRMFWEMARALMELPELSAASERSRIRTASDLTAVLKRPEYRVLWQSDAPQHLPKEVAADLIRAAYVSQVE